MASPAADSFGTFADLADRTVAGTVINIEHHGRPPKARAIPATAAMTHNLPRIEMPMRNIAAREVNGLAFVIGALVVTLIVSGSTLISAL